MSEASTPPRVYAYTITRANTPARCRLLLETLTRGRNTADHPFDWHLHVNGRGIMAEDIAQSCYATKLITSFEVSEHNEGQHPPVNRAIAHALADNYDYLLRTDDDVEWLSKRWLAKLLEASAVFKDRYIVSPVVRGLRWQPPQSQTIEVERIPLRYISGPIGGICRLTPLARLRSKPYTSDVRLPMGGGDAGGVWRWAQQPPITPLAYVQHIRVRHAKSTDEQEREDPQHFLLHRTLQSTPYIPAWVPA